MRSLRMPGSAPLTCWLLSNRCLDSVTNPWKMYDLFRVPARRNDQAHCMHACTVQTNINRGKKRGALLDEVKKKKKGVVFPLSVIETWVLQRTLNMFLSVFLSLFLACCPWTRSHGWNSLSRAQVLRLGIWSRDQTTASAFRVCWDRTPVRKSTEGLAHVRDKQAEKQRPNFCTVCQHRTSCWWLHS